MELVLVEFILLSIYHSPIFQRSSHLFHMSFRSKSCHPWIPQHTFSIKRCEYPLTIKFPFLVFPFILVSIKRCDWPCEENKCLKWWLKDTIWIVLQNEERGSVEYSSHAYAEAEPWAASPLTQSRFASGNSLFGTVLGTVRMGHDSRLAHDRLHRCAARL
jgi:hypothetical protein